MGFNFSGYPAYNPVYNPPQAYPNQIMPTPQQMSQVPMQSQMITQPQQLPQGLSNTSRPVTNREEAISTPADFSGALMVFPDITHNRIYLKRWNIQSGNADFVEFVPVVPAISDQNREQPTTAFASLQDFKVLQDTVDNLQKEIDRLKKPVSGGKAVKEQ